MKELVEKLKQNGLTIASCESLTAGLFCSEIANIPGASSVLCGGFVTYQSDVKVKVAHVSQEIIDKYGVVSSECAYEMASHAQEMFQSDIGISCTGNAGPQAMEDKPVGLVYVGISYANQTQVITLNLTGNRKEIREKVVKKMKDTVLITISEEKRDGENC